MTMYYKLREHAMAFYSPQATEIRTLDTYLQSSRIIFAKPTGQTTSLPISEFHKQEANIRSFLERSHVKLIQVPV
jgi:hypothetical protein